jgi:hypothetical protein
LHLPPMAGPLIIAYGTPDGAPMHALVEMVAA